MFTSDWPWTPPVLLPPIIVPPVIPPEEPCDEDEDEDCPPEEPPVDTPEPGILLLLMIGAGMLWKVRRRTA